MAGRAVSHTDHDHRLGRFWFCHRWRIIFFVFCMLSVRGHLHFGFLLRMPACSRPVRQNWLRCGKVATVTGTAVSPPYFVPCILIVGKLKSDIRTHGARSHRCLNAIYIYIYFSTNMYFVYLNNYLKYAIANACMHMVSLLVAVAFELFFFSFYSSLQSVCFFWYINYGFVWCIITLYG